MQQLSKKAWSSSGHVKYVLIVYKLFFREKIKVFSTVETFGINQAGLADTVLQML